MRILAKVGGAALASPAGRAAFATSVAAARAAGHEVLLVHGGGPQIRTLSERVGLTAEFVDGLRVTDPETAEIALAVLAGTVNKSLVAALGDAGVSAVGLTGADAGLFHVRRARGGALGYVGEIANVEPAFALDLAAAGHVPVIASIAPLGVGEVGPREHLYNVNADAAAGPLAAAFEVDALLLLTDVTGVRGPGGERLPRLGAAQVRALVETNTVAGGMLPKLEAALFAAAARPEALVKIASAAGENALLNGLRSGTGTLLSGSGATGQKSTPASIPEEGARG